jgi:hypothetical protein
MKSQGRKNRERKKSQGRKKEKGFCINNWQAN